MPEELTEITSIRLSLVEQLFLYATEQSTGARSLRRRIVAVIGFDLAVENALRAAITALDPKFKPDTDATHPKLVQHANDALARRSYALLPQGAGIAYLHHVRNDAQHNGRYPSEDEVAECRAHARAFLTELITQIWSIDFQSVSLAGLIRNADVHELLRRAEKEMENRDFAGSVKSANAGFSWLLAAASREFFPRSGRRLWEGLGPVKWNIGLGEPSKPKLDPLIAKELEAMKKAHSDEVRSIRHKLSGLRQQARDEFDMIEEPLLCSLIKLNYADYIRFRGIAGHPRFNAGPQDFSVRDMKVDISIEEAEFVLAFSIDASLQIEAELAIGNHHGTEPPSSSEAA
jgi:hypothetical protein